MSDQPAPPSNLLTTLRELCRLLSSDPLDVTAVKHSLAGMSQSDLVESKPGSAVPTFVRITLPIDTRLTLDALQSTFGPARHLPGLHRGAPIKYLLQVDQPGAPYTCALIISKKSASPYVEAVTIRRDIRLE